MRAKEGSCGEGGEIWGCDTQRLPQGVGLDLTLERFVDEGRPKNEGRVFQIKEWRWEWTATLCEELTGDRPEECFKFSFNFIKQPCN